MKIENNKNIQISKLNENGYKNMTYIEFIPFNKEMSIQYLKRWLPKLLTKYKNEFVLYAQGYNFNGLYETSRDLVKNGCVIQCNYTNNYVSFKGVV